MGRDKKNKPKKAKKYLNFNMSTGSEDLNNVLLFKSNRVEIPYGKSNGSDAELVVMSILEESNIPPGLVLKPKLVKVPTVGESEISDGIILYGDTAFLMQIKSRNKETQDVLGDFGTESKKIDRLISKAYKQTLASLEYIEKQKQVTFENQKNEPVTISYGDYNWVSLIVVNHSDLDELRSIRPLQSDNSSSRKFPRVIMSLQDLEDMSNVFEREPHYILNYLRRLQYQPVHEVGNDMRRFGNFVIEGIHDYDRINFVIEFENVILALHASNQINKDTAKDLLYGLDFMSIEALANQQTFFKGKFIKVTNTPLKDSFTMPHNDTGYVALFYNSQKTPSYVDIAYEANRAGQGYKQRVLQETGKIKRVIAIAVDVSTTNPKGTVGVVLEPIG